jgi:hypothetical protein
LWQTSNDNSLGVTKRTLGLFWEMADGGAGVSEKAAAPMQQIIRTRMIDFTSLTGMKTEYPVRLRGQILFLNRRLPVHGGMEDASASPAIY